MIQSRSQNFISWEDFEIDFWYLNTHVDDCFFEISNFCDDCIEEEFLLESEDFRWSSSTFDDQSSSSDSRLFFSCEDCDEFNSR
jgi:hypothetical protein